MKNDINLLVKRKKARNGKKAALGLLLGLLFLAAFAGLGVWLPMNARSAAEAELRDLNAQLSSSGVGADEIGAMTEENEQRGERLAELAALALTHGDALKYLAVIEDALPATARILGITMAGNEIAIAGAAPGDNEVAAFALHLREAAAFSDVFVVSSAVNEGGETEFALSVRLPVSLSGEAEAEDAAATESAAPAQTEEAVQ